MNRFICIGGYGKKYIYYYKERDEFYISDAYSFSEFEYPEIDEEFEIVKFTDEQEKKLKETKVTDENLIKELREYYEKYKKDEELHQKNLKRVRNRIEKYKKNYEKKNRLIKQLRYGITIAGTLAIASVLTKEIRANIVNKIYDGIYVNHLANQNDEKHLTLLKDALNSNETINDELKSLLNADIDLLIERDIYISDILKFEDICNRLKETDFTNYNVDNYQDLLAKILFNKENIIPISLAYQLDEAANNKEASELSLLFGSLTSGVDADLINDYYFYGENKFISDLAKHYEVSNSELKNLLNLLSSYYEASNPDEKSSYANEFKKKFSFILTNYYRHKWGSNNLDKYTLASQIFNGEFTLKNNLFLDYTVITYDDSNYGTYDLYFDRNGVDISPSIYYEKLVNLIKEKGNDLDYQDKDCRFLMYLVIMCYDDGLYSDYEYLTSSTTPEELADKIMATVFSSDGFTDQRVQVLYSYFTSGFLDSYAIAREVGSPHPDALSLAFFQEFYRCLMLDHENGYLSDEDFAWYNDYLDRLIFNDTIRSKEQYAGYNILADILGTDESLFASLKLYPFTYSYTPGDIKKYIYTKENED